jgi:hypothetical protein
MSSMQSETAKLPKSHSYVLKPSVLEEALLSAGIDVSTHLVRRPGGLFDAHFWPPSPDVPYETLYIRAGSVRASEAAAARQRFETVILPLLVAWISSILAQDRRSPVRREKQRLNLAECWGPLR